ncbi:MAG: flagellar filament capping protein FliD, partial [Cellvibrionaceae bacterium]|nr:flagellar filament capping protein FliD [Cellvibrionaceae bacterium]
QNATVDLTGDSNVDAQDNLKAIQDALDATLGAGQVSASLDGDGLVLTSASTGAAASIQISSDGRAARTAAGSVDTSAFNDLTDFSAASIDFDLNGTAVSVDLSTISVPASGPATLVADIQAQVDAGLVSAGLSAGEIVVAQDSSNRIYFSGNTIAAGESLSITASSNNVLGLSTAGAIAGLDGFGLAQATSSGEDANAATVSFVGGNENGGFNIDLGNGSTFTISAAEDNMASSLGIAVSDGSQNLVKTGQDVAGTINGVAAVGSGQRLTGPEDNDAYGLALNITGDALGKRGSVNFTLGLAEQTQRFLEDLLGANGLLGAKESGFQDSLKEIAKEKADLETRMEGRRASLSRQFTYYDTIVAQLNSSLDFIKANFKALNAANN